MTSPEFGVLYKGAQNSADKTEHETYSCTKLLGDFAVPEWTEQNISGNRGDGARAP